MSGSTSRRKGHDFERQVARQLRGLFPGAKRGYQTRGGTAEAGDIVGTPFRIECKHRANSPNIRAAIAQAEQAPGDGPPLAVTKRTGEPALVTMRLDDFTELLRKAYGHSSNT